MCDARWIAAGPHPCERPLRIVKRSANPFASLRKDQDFSSFRVWRKLPDNGLHAITSAESARSFRKTRKTVLRQPQIGVLQICVSSQDITESPLSGMLSKAGDNILTYHAGIAAVSRQCELQHISLACTSRRTCRKGNSDRCHKCRGNRISVLPEVR